jgi:hypothetical protein
MKRLLKRILRALKKWLSDEPPPPAAAPEPIPFDNSYHWLVNSFEALMKDPVCSQRPQYVWGVLQGAALAKVIGVDAITVIEMGVGAGAGLIAMERAADRCQDMIGMGIQVVGFDTGVGYPQPQDYRDLPFKQFEGDYPCDKDVLEERLRRATVHYGHVKETLDLFLHSGPPRVGFVGFDLLQYSSTRDGLRVFDADCNRLLPRTPCSFRGTMGKDFCEFVGERAAISDFNAAHDTRKLSQIPGMSYFIPPRFGGFWTEMLYTLHVFDHPLYNVPDSRYRSAIIDIDGREIFVEAGPGADLRTARRVLIKDNSQ